MHYFRFWACCLVLLLSACAKQEERPVVTSRIQTFDLSQARAIALRTRVHCSESTQCDEAVAMLIYASPGEVGSCTGFLVSSNIFVTNSHCVPKELRRTNANCHERIWAFFPQIDDTASLRVGCGRVLLASKITAREAPDYAFIELAEHVHRRPLEISFDGVPPGKNSPIIRIDPAVRDNAFEGEMGMEQCRAIERTILTPFYHSPDSPVATVTDCSLRQGNSGAPLLNADHRVWSIAHAALNQDSPLLDPIRSLKLSRATAPLNLVTNLACSQTPKVIPRTEPLAKCQLDHDRLGKLEDRAAKILEFSDFENEPALRQPITDAVLAAMRERLGDDMASAYDWNIELFSKESSIYAISSPQCHSRNSFSNQETIDLPVWRILSGFNAYYQRAFHAVESDLPFTSTPIPSCMP